ncbi:MAG: biotin/lipoyl-containing protein, partial [Alphaproteobacteria bacterium]
MTTPILMPALSPTMEEGKLAKWHVKPGDKVRSGDVIAEIETDKATMEVEAVDEGVVETLLVPEGTEAVKVNTVIAQLREEGAAAAPAKAKPSAAARAPAPVATKPAAIPAKAPAAAPAPRALEGARLSASPLARRLAAEGGVELSRVAGSGPHGRIVKSDIEAALKGGAAKVAPAPARPQPVAAPAPVAVAAAPVAGPDARLFFAKDSYIELPHDSMRKTIARRLTSSKRDIPHYYLKVDCQIDALMDVRKQINAQAP